ncbi:MAG TPA: hypothetical protein VM032_18900 [Vicinamibacterales bacterium]|nr:hypothetical protein [Vicinamibacterales bacterium]
MAVLRQAGPTAGVMLIVVGLIWFFQGLGFLPGSFMSGQPRWAVIGGITVLVGAVLLARSRRRPS